jgi:hypothetical protein
MSRESRWMLLIFALCLLGLIMTLMLPSCCVPNALRQAEAYRAQGYETRIITYEPSFLIRALDLWLFRTHAQAMACKNGECQYVGTYDGQLSDKPTFKNVGRVMVMWGPEEYREAKEAK